MPSSFGKDGGCDLLHLAVHLYTVLCCHRQAPTERQVRYKEKVTEMRKKRNAGLLKEQKEKYMVRLGSGVTDHLGSL